MKGNLFKGNLRRFAPVGLYLSGLAALAAIGLYIVQGSFTLAVQISLAIIIIGLAIYVLFDPHHTRELLVGRQARYGSNALLLTLAFAGIIIVVNYLVSNSSLQWDMTEDKQNSLTDESIETLASLKQPVKAEAFYSPQMASDSARNLLQNFKDRSQDKFDFEFIDPVTDPIRAQQAKITRDGTIVLHMEDRQEQVSFASEEEITGALVRLANPGNRAVYFLTGHGEYGTDQTSENNYNQVYSALTAKNYTVNSLNLLATPKIPDDALAIVVAGPTKPLSQQEVDLIKAYQEKGGSLIYLSEPRPVTEFGDQPDPMAAYLAQTWNITLGEDVVIDPSSSQALVAVSQRFGTHPITQKMYSLVVVMPSARTVQVAEAASQTSTDIKLTPLAYSSDLAWGETDIQSIEKNQVKADEGQDILGPVTLAVAGENSSTSARVLVVGDSDFAGSQGYSNYGNSDFILNSIDWAAEQDSLISLTPRTPIQRFLLPPQRYTMGLILLGSVFLLPGLVILTGVTVWIQRRRRG
jgi:ABC-type uncharacterized transport system involved in gliding motility auxiliary subunit